MTINSIHLDSLQVIANNLTEASFVNIVRYFNLYGAPDTFHYSKNNHALSRNGLGQLIILLKSEQTQMALKLSNQEIDDNALRPFIDDYSTIRGGVSNYIDLTKNCLSDFTVNEIAECEKKIASSQKQLEMALEGQTPNEILTNIRFGSEEEVNKILEDTDLDELLKQRDSIDNTIFHYLAFRGNVSGLSYILNVKKDLNIVNQDGQTPFMYAIQNKKKECIHWFLTRGVLNTIKVFIPLFQALAIANSAEIFELIYTNLKQNSKKKFQKTHHNTSFIHELVSNGAANLLEYCLQKQEFYDLINKRIDISKKSTQVTPLRLLIDANLSEEKSLSVLKVLLDFHSAVSKDDVKILEIGNKQQVKPKIYSILLQYYYLKQFFQDLVGHYNLSINESLDYFYIEFDTQKKLKAKYQKLNIKTLIDKMEKCFEIQFHQGVFKIEAEEQALKVAIKIHQGFTAVKLEAIQQQLISDQDEDKKPQISHKSTDKPNQFTHTPKSIVSNKEKQTLSDIHTQEHPEVIENDKSNEHGSKCTPSSTQTNLNDSSYQVALMSLMGSQKEAKITNFKTSKLKEPTTAKRKKNGESNKERKRREARLKRQQREEKKLAKIEQQNHRRALVEEQRLLQQPQLDEEHEKHQMEDSDSDSSMSLEDLDLNIDQLMDEFKNLNMDYNGSDDSYDSPDTLRI